MKTLVWIIEGGRVAPIHEIQAIMKQVMADRSTAQELSTGRHTVLPVGMPDQLNDYEVEVSEEGTTLYMTAREKGVKSQQRETAKTDTPRSDRVYHLPKDAVSVPIASGKGGALHLFGIIAVVE